MSGAMSHAQADRREDRQTDVQYVPPAKQPDRGRTLRVGAVNDPAEKDADALAEQALAVASSYRAPAGAPSRAPRADLHRAASSGHPMAGSFDVDAGAVDKASGHGAALAAPVRTRMEQGFGADLSGVRVHTGPEAQSLAKNLGARALTVGNDIYFGRNEFKPGTADGDHVLAHELGHVVREGGSPARTAHRFPATVLSEPVAWHRTVTDVFRPGEGVSGGVFILTSKDNGPPKKVVVKPVFGQSGLGSSETATQLTFGDTALRELLGIRTPASRIVDNGSAEFDELEFVMRPKHPPKPAPNPDLLDDPAEHWKPLQEAQSFIVMSEVPNAKSVAGLAESAGTDAKAGSALYRTVFDSNFLFELGKLCVGDLMLQNNDRIVLGAVNLGNVMVSLENGKGQLHAIDTNATLGRKFDPNKVAQDGATKGGGWNNTSAKHMDLGPGFILDNFFEALVRRVQAGTKQPQDPNRQSLWSTIEATYKGNRSHFLSDFESGWEEAKIQLFSLTQDEKGEGTLKSLTDRFSGRKGSDEVTSEALITNASYLGGRAIGGHDESVGRGIAQAFVSWARDIDIQSMIPPPDMFHYSSMGPVPDAKTLKADVPGVPFPATRSILDTTIRFNNKFEIHDEGLQNMLSSIERLGGSVDDAIAPTKTKRTGFLGMKKKEQPRNRNVLGHFLVDSWAMTAGGIRLFSSVSRAKRLKEETKLLTAGKYRSSEAQQVAGAVDLLGAVMPALETNVQKQGEKLDTIQNAVRKTGYPDKEFPNVVLKLKTTLDEGKKVLQDVKGLDLQRVAFTIRQMAKTPVKTG